MSSALPLKPPHRFLSYYLKGPPPASKIHHVAHAFAPEGIVVAQTPLPGTKADGIEEIAFYVVKGN